MNADQVLQLLKNPKKNFYQVSTRKVPTTKSNRYYKKIDTIRFSTIKSMYIKKFQSALRIVPYHARSDEFTLTIHMLISNGNFLHITITNTSVKLELWLISVYYPIELYNGKSGLDKEEYFNTSLSYNIPELALSTEIDKLRKAFPKNHKTKCLQMRSSTVKKFETF